MEEIRFSVGDYVKIKGKFYLIIKIVKFGDDILGYTIRNIVSEQATFVGNRVEGIELLNKQVMELLYAEQA